MKDGPSVLKQSQSFSFLSLFFFYFSAKGDALYQLSPVLFLIIRTNLPSRFLNCFQLEISQLWGAPLPGFTRYALHANTMRDFRVGCSNVNRWISMDHFHRISDPLYQALVHGWWNADLGMNPIPAEKCSIWALAFNDEECSRQRLASNRQVNIDCHPPSWWYIPFEILEHYRFGLDILS